MPSAPLTPTPLVGRHVRLEPLAESHLDALCAVGLAPELWTWGLAPMETCDDMGRYLETALAERARGTAMPYVHVDLATGRAAGSTRFANYAPEHRRVEIGWTWLAPAWQRTALNTEAKRLMFAHAFDVLGVGRVELKADARNARSRAAMRRLGAVEEGTLRRHMTTASGYARDTVYYSILADEWPAVRAHLDALLDARRDPERAPPTP